jgi:hypothetical protein
MAGKDDRAGQLCLPPRNEQDQEDVQSEIKVKTIPLSQGQVAIVDDEDFERLNSHGWYALKSVCKNRIVHYAVRWGEKQNGKKKLFYMHRQILGLNKGVNCDHINGDVLDNRRINLRPCNQSQNGGNSQKQPGTSSRFKGVTWARRDSIWMAQIMVNRHHIYLGNFPDQESAAAAYDRAAEKCFGEFSLTNKAMNIE